MKHLSKSQFWGIAIFCTCFLLTVFAFFTNTKLALGLIASEIFLSICYVTVLVHPLFKKAKPNSTKTDVLSVVLAVLITSTSLFSVVEPMHS
jgi:hypothetical protein